MAKNLKFFKWTGAKTAAAHLIAPTVAEQLEGRDILLVPFAGSLGIVKWLHDKGYLEGKRVIANDLNQWLTDTWQVAQSEAMPQETIRILEKFSLEWENTHDKEKVYYQMRDSVRTEGPTDSMPLNAAIFLFMIRSGFNGLWRESRNGHNVPIGKRANGKYNKMPDWNDVFKAGSWIRGVDIVFNNQTFEDFLNPYMKTSVGRHCVVYSDSPYYASKLQYTKKKFGDMQQQELIYNLELLHQCGARVTYSNSIEVKKNFLFNNDWDLRRIVTKTSIRASKKVEMVECLGVLDA